MKQQFVDTYLVEGCESLDALSLCHVPLIIAYDNDEEKQMLLDRIKAAATREEIDDLRAQFNIHERSFDFAHTGRVECETLVSE